MLLSGALVTNQIKPPSRFAAVGGGTGLVVLLRGEHYVGGRLEDLKTAGIGKS